METEVVRKWLLGSAGGWGTAGDWLLGSAGAVDLGHGRGQCYLRAEQGPGAEQSHTTSGIGVNSKLLMPILRQLDSGSMDSGRAITGPRKELSCLCFLRNRPEDRPATGIELESKLPDIFS
eukprot:gene22846-biopygen8262